MAEIAKANNAVATNTDNNALAIAANKIANIYLSDIANLNAQVGMPMTEESKRCGVNAILYLCSELGAQEVQKLDKAQLVQILQFVTINGLDVNSGQVYIDKRWDKTKNCYKVKACPMGNAYEIMTKRFGVDVKTVHPARVIHEGDEFHMPQFEGTKMTPVIFKPTLEGLDGRAIAVYYIIEKTDGTLDFAIATREGVAKNLMAQILNASLKEAGADRGKLMTELDGMTLEDIIKDPKFAGFVSPSYRSPASRETMIVTKMKANALRHYTRDLGSKAYSVIEKDLEEAERNDMVVGDSYEEEAPAEPLKIADFDVEEPISEEPKKEVEKPNEEEENSAKPQPKVEKHEEIVTEKPIEQPTKEEEAESGQISIFDFDV